MNKRSWDFWDDLGMDIAHTDDIRALAHTLKATTVERKPKNDYKRDFTNLGDQIRGEMSTEALSEINLLLEEGQELTVRAFESGTWPEDFYDIRIEAVNTQDMSENRREVYERGSIAVKDIPPEFEDEVKFGDVYDFAPIHFGGYVVDPIGTQNFNHEYN